MEIFGLIAGLDNDLHWCVGHFIQSQITRRHNLKQRKDEAGEAEAPRREKSARQKKSKEGVALALAFSVLYVELVSQIFPYSYLRCCRSRKAQN